MGEAVDYFEDLASELLGDLGAWTTGASITEDLDAIGELKSLQLQGGVWAVGMGFLVLLLGCEIAEVEASLDEADAVPGQGICNVVHVSGHVLELAVEFGNC